MYFSVVTQVPIMPLCCGCSETLMKEKWKDGSAINKVSKLNARMMRTAYIMTLMFLIVAHQTLLGTRTYLKVVLIKSNFFSRRQPLISDSRLRASLRVLNCSVYTIFSTQ